MISMSGIDCAGKSTQIALLSQELSNRHIRHRIIWSRGGYTPLLEVIKSFVRKDKGIESKKENAYRESIHSNPKKRKLLLWLSIFDLGLYYGVYFRVVELFGVLIIADRYFWDSYIDFKIKYDEFDFTKWTVWKIAKALYLKPESSIIYTIPANLSIYRSTLKDEPWPETLEERQYRIDFYEKEIRNARWQYVINGEDSIQEVYLSTWQCIMHLIKK